MERLKTMVPIRYVMVFIVVMSAIMTMVARMDVNMGITSMTPKIVKEKMDICPLPESAGDSQQQLNPDTDTPPASDRLRDKLFPWDQTTQGHILGSFFYSYIVFQMLSGFLAEKFGGRWIITVCQLGSGVISIVIPFIADHVIIFILLRLLMGVCQSGFFSSAFGIVHKWVPLKERSTCFALLDMGTSVGGIVVFATSGPIYNTWGWPALFFVPGICSLVMFVVAGAGLRSSPSECSIVSDHELKEIVNQDASQAEEAEEEDNNAPLATPWVGIITNKSVLATAFFKFAQSWVATIIATKLPVYLKDVMHQSVEANGIINAGASLAAGISILAAGYLSERVIERKWLERTKCRKVFSLVPGTGTGIFMMCIPAAGCNLPALLTVVLLYCFAAGFKAGSDVPLASEMSPTFPSITYAVMNTISMSSGFMAPAFAGLILDNIADKWYAWSCIYYSAGALAIFGNIIFILFASAERQPFDSLDNQVDEKLEDAHDTPSQNHTLTEECPFITNFDSTHVVYGKVYDYI